MAENKFNILDDFAPISTQEWKDKIIVDLKGADFDKKLVWRTPEGFNVQPFYRQEDLEGLQTTQSAPGQYPFVRGTKENNDWYIRQNIPAMDPKAANAKALDVLNKGINSLGFRIPGKELSADYIATLLDGIYCEVIELNFRTCMHKTLELAQLLADYFNRKHLDLKALRGSINCDPMQQMLAKG